MKQAYTYHRIILGASLLLYCASSKAAAAPKCSAAAIAQAEKLLAFHTEGDDRAALDRRVKELPSVSNPSNKKQKFVVLEVIGFVYKASYRMRFLYYPMDGECVLMGQEILELSSP